MIMLYPESYRAQYYCRTHYND